MRCGAEIGATVVFRHIDTKECVFGIDSLCQGKIPWCDTFDFHELEGGARPDKL